MSTIEQERPFVPVADPAPLGLAAFALTTFLLSGHNATFIPDGDLDRRRASSTAG